MSDGRAAKAGAGSERLLTPKEATQFLRVSLSWLAKARMRGDGPPYIKYRRSIRYTEAGLRAKVTPAFLDQRSVVAASIQAERQLLAGFIVEGENNGQSQYTTIHHRERRRTKVRNEHTCTFGGYTLDYFPNDTTLLQQASPSILVL